MGAYKTGTKGGSFFQLFHWRKPRKKMLATGSSSPERAKQVSENDDYRSAATHIQTEDEDDDFNGMSSVTAGSTDYSCDCASSATNEDITEIRAPGVVARLMGLDFLPTASSSEPCIKPSAELKPLEYVQCVKEVELANPITVIWSNNIYSRKPGGLKCQRMPSSPLDKFQMEVLPTRSKSVSSTHSKLFSPVKSPAVMSQSNAAHLSEASAKLLNPGGLLSSSTTGVHSSSFPRKLHQQPEKSAASEKLSIKLNELNDSRSLRGPQLGTKGNNSAYKMGYQRPCKTEVNLVTSKGYGVATTNQAKVNMHKMGGHNAHTGPSNQSGKRCLRSNKQLKVSIVQKDETERKKSATSMPTSLKPNMRKQNSSPDKDKLPLKSAVGKKSTPGGSASVRNAESKTLPDSSLSWHTLYSKSKGSPHEKSEVIASNVVAKRKRHIKPNVIFDENKQGGDSARKGIDVVSFTFTSIIKQTPVAICEPSMKWAEEENTRDDSSTTDYCKGDVKNKHAKKMIPSNFSLNVVSSDTLNVLLEQKLRELCLELDSSRSKEPDGTSGTCSSQDLLSSSPLDTLFEIEEESLDVSCRQDDLHCLSAFGTASDNKHEIATSCSSEDACKIPNYQQESLGCLPNESFRTSESYNYSNENGKYAFQSRCGNPFCTEAEGSEKQISESSASPFEENKVKGIAGTCSQDCTTRYKEQDEYLKKILLLAESSFTGSGLAGETLDPCVFELLETMIDSSKSISNDDKSYRAERKLLFDCVCESFALKNRRYFCAGYNSWVKGTIKVAQGQFPNEIYKEILGWRRSGDLIDELVEDDMSRCVGKTVYFSNDTFEAGIVIEGDILTSLIREVVEEFVL